MRNFMMLMVGEESEGDWEKYIEKLNASGKFLGGSSLGRGLSIQKEHQESHSKITGFMRFVAEDIDQVRNLLVDNPAYEAGCKIEILEELMD